MHQLIKLLTATTSIRLIASAITFDTFDGDRHAKCKRNSPRWWSNCCGSVCVDRRYLIMFIERQARASKFWQLPFINRFSRAHISFISNNSKQQEGEASWLMFKHVTQLLAMLMPLQSSGLLSFHEVNELLLLLSWCRKISACA